MQWCVCMVCVCVREREREREREAGGLGYEAALSAKSQSVHLIRQLGPKLMTHTF